MTYFTFDTSPELGQALVATADLRNPHYQSLCSAPTDTRPVDRAYLVQLHTVANGVVAGLTAHPRQPLVPAQWDRLKI